MKILFCDNSLRELVNFREKVFDDFAEKGHDIVLLAPKNRDYVPKYGNVKVLDIDLKRGSMNPISDLGLFFKLVRIYRSENPDYVIHYTIKPNVYGSLAAAILRIPSTSMIAGLGYTFSSNTLGCRVARSLYRFAMKFPEHILVLNKYNRDLILSRKIGNRKQVILLKGGEGVDLDKFKI